MIDCSLLEESNRISNEHTKALAIRQRDSNFYKYRSDITTPTTSFKSVDCIDNDQISKELLLMQGFRIDKNSCIFKKPEYNTGSWKNQGQNIMATGSSLFNIQTKRR